jgi:DNA (cytosine-5)-methyltransferase 1
MATEIRPRLLDLFCGAGGAGMGYHRAGFDVTGVDINPQPHYPFAFIQADALEYLAEHGHEFDAIHASPPCQRYSVANNIHGHDHPDLLPATRDALIVAGRPWVIENVPGAPMPGAVVVCGLTLGCNVKRHRLFESDRMLFGTGCPKGHPGDWLLVFGHAVLERGHTIGVAKGGGPVIRRKHTTTARGREAMGIDWMNRDELSEAIPPAYTEHIGRQLLSHLSAA